VQNRRLKTFPLDGGGLGGVTPLQIFNNRRAPTLGILQYLMILEPQDAVALVMQETAPPRFMQRRRVVLTPVRFDDQARVMATKTGNAASERHLTAESVLFDLTRPQYSPDTPLGVGHLVL
jgi:hypothetical protein